jgi:lysophospholipase L1-like esterase
MGREHTDEAGQAGQPPGFRRFVAVGDSTTEGMDDPAPGGGYRGWADRLAVRLAALDRAFEYANLAVRGRYVRQVRDEQLAPALAMRPDLVSIIAGVNDLLRPRWDPADVVAELDAMYAAARDTGATVLTITQPDPVAVLRMARPVQRRLREYNAGVRECARRRGLVLVDFARMPESVHPLAWSVDRLHLNTLGHTRAAATMAHALGLPDVPGDPWIGPGAVADAQLGEAPVLGRARAVAADLDWTRRYLAPWLWRHLRGRSSGDGMTAKRPVPGPVRLWQADPP